MRILLVEMWNELAAEKTVLKFLKKLNIELPFDPSTPLQGIYSKALKPVFKQLQVHAYSQQYY